MNTRFVILSSISLRKFPIKSFQCNNYRLYKYFLNTNLNPSLVYFGLLSRPTKMLCRFSHNHIIKHYHHIFGELYNSRPRQFIEHLLDLRALVSGLVFAVFEWKAWKWEKGGRPNIMREMVCSRNDWASR